MQKAVFFDRDGVLNIDNDFVTNINQIKLFEEAPGIISYCRTLGYKIFVVTNQAVVARGMMPEEELIKLNKQYAELFREKNPEALIDKIFYCPHHPNANVEEYRKICECRKPKAGMIFQAAKEFGISLEESFLIGDRISDIIAGKSAGCKTIQFLSGKHNDSPIVSDIEIDINTRPDYFIHTLNELKEVIK